MENIKKPELEPKEIGQMDKLIALLKGRQITKMAIAEELALEGAESSKERKAREIVAMVAKRHPVIALSGQKGYRIAKSDDIEDAVHQIKDIDSRIANLEERKAPLWRFIEDYMRDNGIANIVELEQKLGG